MFAAAEPALFILTNNSSATQSNLFCHLSPGKSLHCMILGKRCRQVLLHFLKTIPELKPKSGTAFKCLAGFDNVLFLTISLILQDAKL